MVNVLIFEMILLREASIGRTIITFKTNVKQGEVPEVPRQPTNADSFLKEGHIIGSSIVLRRESQ